MILAARANHTFSFLCSRVADAFLVCIITWIACSTSSSSLPADPLENSESHISGHLDSSILTISGLYISSSVSQFMYFSLSAATTFSISSVPTKGACILRGNLVLGSI